MIKNISRGEIWLADLNPVVGHEQSGIRPILIISDNYLNHGSTEMVIMVPITSTYRGLYAHVRLDYEFLKNTCYAKTEDIRAISTRRVQKKLGSVDTAILNEIEEKIKYLLGFK